MILNMHIVIFKDYMNGGHLYVIIYDLGGETRSRSEPLAFW